MLTQSNTPTHIDTSERVPLGRIVSISGSQAIVLVHNDIERTEGVDGKPAELGALLKIETPNSFVLGLISALSVPVPSQDQSEPEMRIIELEFVGEIEKDDSGAALAFRRGVSSYPALGQEVFHVSQETLALVYVSDAENSVRIGSILQAPEIPAMVRTDELLGKHLAVLGATGSGKSCSVALLLREILKKTPNAHILLLDPHREYAPAFGDMAEVITANNLSLPFWLLTFEEIAEILIGDSPGRETDVETLRELIPIAKSRYGINQRRGELRSMLSKSDNGPLPSIDTPVPYRISDIVALLEELIGRLELRGELAPYKRLKARIETISRDPRFAFLFGNLTVQDTMADFLSRIFRVPVDGKPVTLIELAGLPSEVINVVVSVLSRMSFDFAHWSGGRVPITLVCEEAHRYVPMDTSLGFEPTKRALSKIAKEGRKYGVSLCVVSQRPAEIDPTILSQCATIFGMRLPNERDQEILRARVSDASASLLDVLPTLGTGEAVVFGEGVALPTRIRFDRLGPNAMPRSTTAKFSKIWQHEVGSHDFMQEVVSRWRAHSSGAILQGSSADQETADLPSADEDTAPPPDAPELSQDAPASTVATEPAAIEETPPAPDAAPVAETAPVMETAALPVEPEPVPEPVAEPATPMVQPDAAPAPVAEPAPVQQKPEPVARLIQPEPISAPAAVPTPPQEPPAPAPEPATTHAMFGKKPDPAAVPAPAAAEPAPAPTTELAEDDSEPLVALEEALSTLAEKRTTGLPLADTADLTNTQDIGAKRDDASKEPEPAQKLTYRPIV